MTVYTALPADDLNLAVEVTESNDMVTINITPAIVNTGGGGTGTVTNVASGTGLLGGPITTTGTLSVDVGTTANKIVQLDATAKLPAVDGSQLTNLPGGGGSGTVTSIIAGTGLSGGTITTTGTVAIDATVATLTGTQTLTNKTLTSVVLGGTTTSASGNIVLDPATHLLEVKGGGSDSGAIVLNCYANTHGQTLKSQPHSENITNTMLLPKGVSSTLVSEVSASALTNKTGLISQWTNDAGYGTGSTTINNNGDNRIITGSSSADTLNAESNFSFDGSTAELSGTAANLTTPVLEIKGSTTGWNKPQLMLTDSVDDATSIRGEVNTGTSSYVTGITLDPNHTQARSGPATYAGDYSFQFEKYYGDASTTAMAMKVFGANDGFQLKVYDDYNGGTDAYAHKQMATLASQHRFFTGSDASTRALDITSGGIKFFNSYTFPTADGTANQVLTTDGAGNITFAAAGGGGATDLNSLTDVTITSVQNNDLLMYNSTASKWQNTNLGVSVTPTLTGNTSGFSGQTYTLTISNHATYQDPAYNVEVYTGATKVVDNSAVTDNLDGTLTFTAPANGTHEIRVRCQDFGDLQSEIATKALTTITFEFNYRYFRILFNAVISSGTLIPEFALYTAAAQGGTKWPTSALTSNTAPTPFVASGQGAYSIYDYWKAFDNGAGQFWNLAGTPNTDYLAIDLGSTQLIKSFKIRTAGFVQASMQLQASATNAWSGEEVVIENITPTVNSTINIG